MGQNRSPQAAHLVELGGSDMQPTSAVLRMQLRQALVQAAQPVAQLGHRRGCRCRGLLRCAGLCLASRRLLQLQLLLRLHQLAPNGLQLSGSSAGPLLRSVGRSLSRRHRRACILQLLLQLHSVLAAMVGAASSGRLAGGELGVSRLQLPH